MKVSKNIEHFNLVTLSLLTKLYESFPSPLNINSENINDFGFSIVPEDASGEESWEIGTMVNDVIIFLAEEGFLRYDKDPNCNEGNFWRTRLTLKGFTILGALPQTLSTAKEKSLFERAQESLNSVTGTAGAEAGKQVVAEIFKLALVGAS